MSKQQKQALDYFDSHAGDWKEKALGKKVDLVTYNGLSPYLKKYILEEEIRRTGAKRESLGIVVVGTVFGDIHDIGKAMVCTFLTAGGFEVHDLGVNVRAEQFAEATNNYKADVLAMSALLTTTAAEQRKIIGILKEKGIRESVKIMVGGGAITQEFADDIGADGYDPTAPGAVELARRLIGK